MRTIICRECQQSLLTPYGVSPLGPICRQCFERITARLLQEQGRIERLEATPDQAGEPAGLFIVGKL